MLGDPIGRYLLFARHLRKLPVAHEAVDIFSLKARIHNGVGAGFHVKAQGRSAWYAALGRIPDSDDGVLIFYSHTAPSKKILISPQPGWNAQTLIQAKWSGFTGNSCPGQNETTWQWPYFSASCP